MSFSKAKLQRFNESQNCTPSPADYNVSLKSHVAGAVIPKSGRFAELRSPLSSDNGSFISHASVPTFRTPNPPRRLKLQSQSSFEQKAKPAVELFEPTNELEALKERLVEINNKDQYIQELTEQLEEMKQQLSDMEAQIARLKGDKLQLEERVVQLDGVNEKAVQDIQAKHHSQLSNLSIRIIDLNNKMIQLKEEYSKLREENKNDLNSLLKNLESLEKLHNSLTESYNVLVDNKTKEIEIKDKHVQELEGNCLKLQEDHEIYVDNLQKKHKMEIQDIEYEMLKTVTEIQKRLEKDKHNYDKCLKELQDLKQTELVNLQNQFEQEKLSLQNDAEAKIKQLMENHKEASMLAEIQAKEKCTDIEMTWQLKLNEAKQEAEQILKECQAITEYNIIQCEIEKNKAVYELTEQKKELEHLQAKNTTIKTECDNLDQQYKDLQSELSRVIIELNNVRANSAKELEGYKESVEQLTKNKHTYEITIIKTHKTVETLKKRLMRSDSDVEQLKAELEATEMSRLEFEGKCSQLMEELEVVCSLCDDVEEQNELALKVAEEKVSKLEQELCDKVDSYKQEANAQVNNITMELTKTKGNLLEVMEHLHEQQKINSEAQILIFKSQEEIERLEHVSSEYTIKITYLEAAFDNIQIELAASRAREMTLNIANMALKDENKKLNTVIDLMQASDADLIKQIGELKQKCKGYEECQNKTVEREKEDMGWKYIELSEKYDALLSKLDVMENDNSSLRKKVAEQESLIGPFREHLEAYEMEYNSLMNQKKDAEKEAKEMGMKYAQILGHQNQKQKIKHLMDLKKKNYELSENKKELEVKLRTQMRTIDKLKKELSTSNQTKSPRKLFQTDEKENVGSPNRTLNSSRIEGSPGGPLRDRN